MCNSVAQSTYSVLCHHHYRHFRDLLIIKTEARCPFVGFAVKKGNFSAPSPVQGPACPKPSPSHVPRLPSSCRVRLHAAGHHLCVVFTWAPDYILWQLLVWALWLQPETLQWGWGKGVLRGGSFVKRYFIKVEEQPMEPRVWIPGANPLICSWVCHTRNY